MKYLIPVILIAVLLFYFFLPATKDDDVASKIEILLNNLVESGERQDIDVVMEYFSPEYNDSDGRTYLSIKKIIENAFERFDTIDGGYSNLAVSTIEDENGEPQTTANLDIWIKGTKSGSNYKLVGSQDKPKNVNIAFESIMFGGWKVLNIEGLE